MIFTPESDSEELQKSELLDENFSFVGRFFPRLQKRCRGRERASIK